MLSTPIPDGDSIDVRSIDTNGNQKRCVYKIVDHRHNGVFNTKKQTQPIIRYFWMDLKRLADFNLIYHEVPDQNSEECRTAIRL